MIEMTLDMAQRIAQATLAKARELGVNMTVSVVDEAGRLVLCMKGDRTGFLTTETSRAKAVAAAAFRSSTRDLAALHATNPFWSALPTVSAGTALPTAGAVPVKVGDRVVGAVGCGGGTGEQDDECARAGAGAISG